MSTQLKGKYLIIGLRNCRHVYTEIMADNLINITRHVRLILKLVWKHLCTCSRIL